MNDLPRVIDRSDAIFNRVYLIPMNHVIPMEKRDTRLTEKLRAEMSGIFNLALIGLKRLQRAHAFTRCEQVESARDEYKAENDTELAFVQDWCDITDQTATIEAQRLYDAYASWCRRNGAMAKSSTKVARDWQRLGFIRKRSAGTWYIGLKLNTVGEKHGT